MTPIEFEAFYSRWQPTIVRYMASKVFGAQNAEDLAQDLFATLAQGAHDLRSATADRYMWVSARYVALHARVQWGTQPLTFSPSLDSGDSMTAWGTTPNPAAARLTYDVYHHRSQIVHAEDQAVCDQDAMQRELATLPPREREIIEATVLNNVTMSEYAVTAGVSAGRIGQLRDRGLERLRVARWRS